MPNNTIIHFQFKVIFHNGDERIMYLGEDRRDARHFEISYQADRRVKKVIRAYVDKRNISTDRMKLVVSRSTRLAYYVDHRSLIAA